jgi:hypothetical protein
MSRGKSRIETDIIDKDQLEKAGLFYGKTGRMSVPLGRERGLVWGIGG